MLFLKDQVQGKGFSTTLRLYRSPDTKKFENHLSWRKEKIDNTGRRKKEKKYYRSRQKEMLPSDSIFAKCLQWSVRPYMICPPATYSLPSFPTLHLLTLLQPHWSSSCSMDMPSTRPTQGHCTCFSFCLE